MAAQSSSLMTPSSTVTIQRSSAWQSPVPYLFGGLAIVMGLISFALLILACSYWKLSRNVHNDTEISDTDRDLEAGNNKVLPVFEEKYVVIMAGQDKPTFLATPSSSRPSSFGSCSCRSGSTKNLVEGLSTRVIEGDESNESASQVS